MYCEAPAQCRFSAGFDDNCSRLCFIRRVFVLLIIALMLMFAQILVVDMVDDVKSILTEFYWLAFIGVTIFISVCMLLSCSSMARSCFPWNFILFLMLVESLTMILAVVAAMYSGVVILMTIACQALVLLLLLVLSMTVPVDFTKWTALFLVLFLIVFTYAITTLLSEFVLKFEIMSIVYSFVAVTFLSVIMLMNLQVLFNGAIFELYPDDYMLGAILMFADVIILLMCCLKLIGFDTDEC